MDMMASSSSTSSELSPAPAAAAAARVKCEGVVFTATEGNEVAVVASGGAVRVLGSESFLDADDTCTRHHFVDVQGKAEAMLFLVSVCEDLRRVVAVQRFS